MYQQPVTQALSTRQLYRTLKSTIEDDRKLTSRDLLMTVAQVGGALAACGALHLFV